MRKAGRPVMGDPVIEQFFELWVQWDVRDVAFSPDGHRLATGSYDTTVRRWDADTGQPICAPLTGHTHAVFSVAFSPDGHHLASASKDATVRLWLAVASPVMLCAKLIANMNHEQWRDWVSSDIEYTPACPNLPTPSIPIPRHVVGGVDEVPVSRTDPATLPSAWAFSRWALIART